MFKALSLIAGCLAVTACAHLQRHGEPQLVDSQCRLAEVRAGLALVILKSPELAAEKRRAHGLYASVYEHWPEAVRKKAGMRVEPALNAQAASAAIRAVNIDPANPVVLRSISPAYWLGETRLPDSRMGADNADTTYALVPVNANYRYILEGRWKTYPPTDFNISVVTDVNSQTQLSVLAKDEIVTDDEGRFSVLVDNGVPAATGGDETAPNRLVIPPTARALVIRDTMNSWSDERPAELSIRRLGAGSALEPLDEVALGHAAAGLFRDEVQLWTAIQKTVFHPDQINTIGSPVMPKGGKGLLLNQARADTTFLLTDNDALIVTIDPAGAAYASIGLSDAYAVTIDPERVQSSLNLAQFERAEDGRITAVIAPRDPGVPNWISTGGHQFGLVSVRWQGLAQGALTPSVQMEAVEFNQIAQRLPGQWEAISPAERKAHLAVRQAAYRSRFDYCGGQGVSVAREPAQ